MHRLQELVRLYRMGTGSRELARLLGMSPNTERRYRKALEEAELLEGDAESLPPLAELKEAVEARMPSKPMPQHDSTVSRWEAEVEEMVARGAGPRAIYDQLRLDEEGFDGSLSAIKRLVGRLERSRPPRAEDVAIPVETWPGEVAQVDFGYVGELYDPQQAVMRRAWVFVMVLGYSRQTFAEIVFDQKSETWLALHDRAFRTLGGVPETVRPDNLKAAVIKGAFGANDHIELNRNYRELARHYGFKIDPTPPRSAQKKGKVESGVKYVKNNFFKPRDLVDVRDARRELVRWLEQIANSRTHGHTGRVPVEVFESEEKPALKALPSQRYELVLWKQAKVHPDSHVVYAKRQYSVPWTYIGRWVWVRGTPHTVAIYADEERIATHSRRGAGPRSTIEAHLPDQRAELRWRSRDHWLERARSIGPEVESYVAEVFDADDVLQMLRQVQSIVTHLMQFPADRARNACRRASYYGNHSYRGLKDILRKGLDYESLPSDEPTAPSGLETPKYARPLGDLLSNHTETRS